MSREVRARRRTLFRHVGVVLFVLATFGSFGGGCSGCGCGPREPSMGSCGCSSPSLSCSSGCSPPGSIDAGPGDVPAPSDAGRDAPFSTFDVPRAPCDYSTPGSGVGSACSTGETCAAPLMCQPEVLVPLAMGGTRPLPPRSCSEACDPLDDRCGPCGRCSTELPVGAGRLRVPPLCRPRCRPSALDRGDCPPRFTCDPRSAMCVPACTTDADCQLEPVVTAAGVVFADAPSLSCDGVTGRCVHVGPSVGHGAPCRDDLDCGARDECFRPNLAREGMCTRFGCSSLGRECNVGAVCEREACLLPCTTSADCPSALGCEPASSTCQLTCTASTECPFGTLCESELGCALRCVCVARPSP